MNGVAVEPFCTALAIVYAPVPDTVVVVVLQQDGLAVDLAHVEVRGPAGGPIVATVGPPDRPVVVVVTKPPVSCCCVVLQHDALALVPEEERVRGRLRLPVVDSVWLAPRSERSCV